MIKDNQDGTFSIVRLKVWDDEPVAFVTGVRQFDPVMADTVLKVGTPLYTHPAKTLTDEEIIKLFDSYEFSDEGVVEFAHELLRKAQEK